MRINPILYDIQSGLRNRLQTNEILLVQELHLGLHFAHSLFRNPLKHSHNTAQVLLHDEHGGPLPIDYVAEWHQRTVDDNDRYAVSCQSFVQSELASTFATEHETEDALLQDLRIGVHVLGDHVAASGVVLVAAFVKDQ